MMMEALFNIFLDTGNSIVSTWIGVLVAVGLVVGLSRVFTHVRKIQDRKHKWSNIRYELFWSALNVATTAIVLKTFSAWLVSNGYLTTDPSPVAWYVILFEFMLYFFVFDLWFYTAHRIMHIEPIYSWTHKIHHRSMLPNPLSSTSMHPIEGVIEGLIIPLFLAAFTVHEATMMFIIPFATLMGLYVHCGYEMMPKWWYKTWATRWFISPMFHDQHHLYVTCNYGGYTTIWDFVFKTVRTRFLQDYDNLSKKAVERRREKTELSGSV